MSIKQGSVMEGIFAMYCAGYLVDPQDGRDKIAIAKFIDDLRIDTTLGQLIDKSKKSVDYNNTFPAKSAPAKKNFKPITIVTGRKAKEMIKGSAKYDTLSGILVNSEDYFESVGTEGYIDFSQVELKVRVKEAETGAYYGPNLKKLIEKEKKKGTVKDTKYNDIISQGNAFSPNGEYIVFTSERDGDRNIYLMKAMLIYQQKNF